MITKGCIIAPIWSPINNYYYVVEQHINHYVCCNLTDYTVHTNNIYYNCLHLYNNEMILITNILSEIE